MKFRDKILTGVLLILIGVLLGMIMMIFGGGGSSGDMAEVRITEVKRSEGPLWNEGDLEKIDDRFIFRNVVRRVTPTVVYIETVVSTRNRSLGQDPESDEDGFWQRFIPPRARTVGSGVVITSDGYILTNNHVIEDAVRGGIQVTLEDKRSFEARVVGRDPSTDLAIIKVDAQNLDAALIGNSDLVEVGEWVLAIGNPFRLRSTVTAGIVSALSRDIQVISDALRIESFIQTDAAINRGNSGGALVNTSGELVGINTAIATQNGNYQGYGFAVPSNLALRIARDLIEFGEVKRGMLGVTIAEVDERTARHAGLDRIRGVRIMEVLADGAAAKGGIEASDLVLKVNGEPVSESNRLQEKVAMFRPGDNITLTIWRDMAELDLQIELGEILWPQEPANNVFPEDFDDEPEIDEPGEIPGEARGRGIEQERFYDFGFTVRAIATPENPDKYNLYIHHVEKNSEAWNRGLREGFEILEVNGEHVSTLRELKKHIVDSVKMNRSLSFKTETTGGTTGFFRIN